MPLLRSHLTHLRTPVTIGVLGLAALLGACGGKSDQLEASADEVDLSTPIEITEREYAAFRAPANGQLTEEQVSNYLKTSLLQFDLVREQSERLHERLAAMEKRAEKGGTVAGLRNLVDATQTFAEVGDIFEGSYIRSARTLGYNPAEMEWVRERIQEVGEYLAVKPMREAAAQGAAELRANVAKLREEMASSGVAYYSEADLQQLLSAADEMEANAQAEENQVSREALANFEVLRRARPAVTDHMWMMIILSGGAGSMGFAGLAGSEDTEMQQQLSEFRTLFEDALANRVTAGMEKP